MTRKQIDYLIRIHTGQRDYAKAYLDEHYYELEEQDRETEWINRYLYHKRIVDDLLREMPEGE